MKKILAVLLCSVLLSAQGFASVSDLQKNRFDESSKRSAIQADAELADSLADTNSPYEIIANDFYVRESRYMQDREKLSDQLKMIGWGLFAVFAYNDAKEVNSLFLNACTVAGVCGFVIKFGDVIKR